MFRCIHRHFQPQPAQAQAKFDADSLCLLTNRVALTQQQAFDQADLGVRVQPQSESERLHVSYLSGDSRGARENAVQSRAMSALLQGNAENRLWDHIIGST